MPYCYVTDRTHLSTYHLPLAALLLEESAMTTCCDE
jgi:hypothetical protein